MRHAVSAARLESGRVVDPGVFISALIGRRGSAPDIVVRAFARYAAERMRRELVERLRRNAEIVDDPVEVPGVTRDPNDDYVVALARQEASTRS
jgi:hypothetical protein